MPAARFVARTSCVVQSRALDEHQHCLHRQSRSFHRQLRGALDIQLPAVHDSKRSEAS